MLFCNIIKCPSCKLALIALLHLLLLLLLLPPLLLLLLLLLLPDGGENCKVWLGVFVTKCGGSAQLHTANWSHPCKMLYTESSSIMLYTVETYFAIIICIFQCALAGIIKWNVSVNCNFPQNKVHWSVQYNDAIVCSVQCVVCCVHQTLEQCTMCSVQCAVCTRLWNSVQCAVCRENEVLVVQFGAIYHPRRHTAHLSPFHSSLHHPHHQYQSNQEKLIGSQKSMIWIKTLKTFHYNY